ncbi:MAG: EAL domain-containing protein [Proteobacteria bacterium]|nr:EAL domain-containing protein [Pseudomonadota bacterium]
MPTAPDCLELMDCLADAISTYCFAYRRDSEGRFTAVSPAVRKVLGYAESQFLAGQESYRRATASASAAPLRPGPELQAAAAAQGASPWTVAFLHQAGGLVRLELRERPCFDAAGRVEAYEGVARDVTELWRTAEALRESEEKYRHTMDASLVGIYVIQDLRFRYVNSTMATLFGYAPEEIVDRLGPADLVLPQYRERVSSNLQRRAGGEEGTPYEIGCLRRDGTTFDGVVWGKRILYQGQPASVGTLADVSHLKRVERELRRQKDRVEVTLGSLGEGVVATDAEGRVEYLNPVAEALTGWRAAEAGGRRLSEVLRVVDGVTGEPPPDPVAACRRDGARISLGGQSVLLGPQGAAIPIQACAAPIRGPAGEPEGVVIVFRDVSEARQLAAELSHQATHDALTGLINRLEFDRRLELALASARAGDAVSVLCYIDLDQFKLVNDTCGHVAGDALLRQVGQAIRELARRTDALARLGGDEFGLLLAHCTTDQALRVAQQIIARLARSRFAWDGQVFLTTVSIGLAVVDATTESTVSVLSAADAACYLAKDLGRNRIQVHHEASAEVAKREGEMRWAVALPRAIEEDRFVLFSQPITRVLGAATGREHYEILLRLKNPAGQIVYPGDFLPAAERYSLASSIDRWVIRSTFRWLRAQPQRLDRLATCAINISGQSLGEESFLGDVLEQLSAFGIPGAKICFEITETVAVANLSAATAFIEALNRRGCRFALDDFGSGLSSFAYLKRLPVDFIKIDGFFVRDMLDDAMGYAIVKSINEIGKTLGKRTIAEFVETPAILDALRTLGVDFAQGYGIGRPQPLPEA